MDEQTEFYREVVSKRLYELTFDELHALYEHIELMLYQRRCRTEG